MWTGTVERRTTVVKLMNKNQKNSHAVRKIFTATAAAALACVAFATPAQASQGSVPVTNDGVVSIPTPVNVVKVRAGEPNTTVMGNLTVTGPQGRGFTTVYPCLEGLPMDGKGNVNASVNNYLQNQTIPNFAAIKTDTNGDICIYSSTRTHLIWDQVMNTDRIVSTTPQRIVDTRKGYCPEGDVCAQVIRPVEGRGILKIRAGAPNTTVMGNLTVTAPQASGFTTVFPCTDVFAFDTKSNPSSVNNYAAGQTVPNFTAVKTDQYGDICVYTTATTHLIWDQVVETDAIKARPAKRILDTREYHCPPNSICTQMKNPVQAGKNVKIRVGAPHSTVMGNLTVTTPQSSGFTTAYPCTSERPNASVNNYTANKTVSNFAAVKADENGDICVYTTATAHIIWDQTVETSEVEAQKAQRLLDTRVKILSP